ncbi:MAG: hypothetical protein V7K55_11160 [Nostoc sp.]
MSDFPGFCSQITNTVGRESQKSAYRSSLGLKSSEQAPLCQT